MQGIFVKYETQLQAKLILVILTISQGLVICVNERRIVLASGSPRRRELLAGIGLSFDVIVSHVDETVDEEMDPPALVQELAYRKAHDVAKSLKYGLVIGADTIVVIDDEVLGKPTDVQDAIRMLSRLQGRTHSVYSGIAIIDAKTSEKRIAYSRTDVKMRSLSASEIERYVSTGEPMDKAGSYAIQGIGAILIDSIQGDYFTVVGLPLSLLASMLSTFDIDVLGT
ncbi:Maf-like protein [Collibacillus ludicampi]|uniref:dTTP/UTP pyrophosphatase n=1 Tax=Collibacillus ludicampi TaxID=2771369 RepID=A0AAV4LA68_9BACL|nr:Maf-like protein [Collibacillus ludicampi]